MKLLTLGEASRQTGIGARILKRAVGDGRLPAQRLDGWVYQIEFDDLARFSLADQVERLTSSARQKRDVAERPSSIAWPSKHSGEPLQLLKALIDGIGLANMLPARRRIES